MGEKATTVDEQIALLTSTGMLINIDITKTKEILLDIIDLVFIGIVLSAIMHTL